MATTLTPAPPMRSYPHHAGSHAVLRAPMEAVFERLDEHTRAAAHMNRPSWRTGWSRMTTTVDERGGREVGSHIRLEGKVLGLALSLDEVVMEREPPRRKVWETVGAPRLLVIGPYRMGFELVPQGAGAVGLTVFIDYEWPARGVPRLLGRLLGSWYARWCTARLTADAATDPEIARA
jgi:hypothetical protein